MVHRINSSERHALAANLPERQLRRNLGAKGHAEQQNRSSAAGRRHEPAFNIQTSRELKKRNAMLEKQAVRGNLGKLKAFLKKGADPYIDLSKALQSDHLDETLGVLIEHGGADVDKWLAKTNDPEVALALLRHGDNARKVLDLDDWFVRSHAELTRFHNEQIALKILGPEVPPATLAKVVDALWGRGDRKAALELLDDGMAVNKLWQLSKDTKIYSPHNLKNPDKDITHYLADHPLFVPPPIQLDLSDSPAQSIQVQSDPDKLRQALSSWKSTFLQGLPYVFWIGTSPFHSDPPTGPSPVLALLNAGRPPAAPDATGGASGASPENTIVYAGRIMNLLNDIRDGNERDNLLESVQDLLRTDGGVDPNAKTWQQVSDGIDAQTGQERFHSFQATLIDLAVRLRKDVFDPAGISAADASIVQPANVLDKIINLLASHPKLDISQVHDEELRKVLPSIRQAIQANDGAWPPAVARFRPPPRYFRVSESSDGHVTNVDDNTVKYLSAADFKLCVYELLDIGTRLPPDRKMDFYAAVAGKFRRTRLFDSPALDVLIGGLAHMVRHEPEHSDTLQRHDLLTKLKTLVPYANEIFRDGLTQRIDGLLRENANLPAPSP